MWKQEWYDVEGNVQIRALCSFKGEEGEEKGEFIFEEFIKPSLGLCNLDKKVAIIDFVLAAAKLRGFSFEAILDIKEIKEDKRRKKIAEIEEILSIYTQKDAQRFDETVDMLCQKGIGGGVYQDYRLLTHVISILSIMPYVLKETPDKTEGGAR